MKSRIKLGVTDPNKLKNILLYCTKWAIQVINTSPGEFWVVGHSIRVGCLLEKFWPNSTIKSLMEPVPEFWELDNLMTKETAEIVSAATRCAQLVEATMLVEKVHSLINDDNTALTYIQIQCLGSEGPWAVSFDSRTVGAPEPWFEEDNIDKYTFAVIGYTIEGAMKNAAIRALSYLTRGRSNELLSQSVE